MEDQDLARKIVDDIEADAASRAEWAATLREAEGVA